MAMTPATAPLGLLARNNSLPRLRSFALKQPSPSLHVIRSIATMDGNQAAVNLALESVDLRQEDSLVAIRFGLGAYPGYHVDPVFGSDYLAVWTPKPGRILVIQGWPMWQRSTAWAWRWPPGQWLLEEASAEGLGRSR